jgi:alkylated DNA repair dioxygenase AlkB
VTYFKPPKSYFVKTHRFGSPGTPFISALTSANLVFFMTQTEFFEERKAGENLPEGMRYRSELIPVSEEVALLEHVRQLPFKEFEFHGYKGKRRTVSFGWQYEFSGRGRLREATDIPKFLLPLRVAVAAFAQIEPEMLQHVLVVEYGPGAGIGWHRDKPVFGEVIGVSLLAPCVLRFRRKQEPISRTEGNEPRAETKQRSGAIRSRSADNGLRDPKLAMWERVNLLAKPRSAYHLTGPARSEWQHSILRVDELRYSITFRNLLELSHV